MTCANILSSGMKNIEQDNSDKIPSTPQHSNLIAAASSSEQGCKEKHLISGGVHDVADQKGTGEEAKHNLISNKPSISHPKVIDILDNQLQQL